MVLVCRAEDGQVFKVPHSALLCRLTMADAGDAQAKASLYEIERLVVDSRIGCEVLTKMRRTGNIEHFLSQETGVDPDAVLAFLSDGRRLQTENVRELAGSQDQVGVMPGLRRAAR
jgi:hypothetical protein